MPCGCAMVSSVAVSLARDERRYDGNMVSIRPRRRSAQSARRPVAPQFERNACWRCSYPTEQIDTCPECGANTRRFGVPGVKRPQEWLAVQLFVLRLVRLAAIASILSVVAIVAAFVLPIGLSGQIAIVVTAPLAIAVLAFRSGLPPVRRVGSPVAVYGGVPASLVLMLVQPTASVFALTLDYSSPTDSELVLLLIALVLSLTCSTLILLVLERAEVNFRTGLWEWRPLVGTQFAVLCAFVCYVGYCTYWLALPAFVLLYPCVLIAIIAGSRRLEKLYRSLSVVPE